MAILGNTGYSVDTTTTGILSASGLSVSLASTTNWPSGGANFVVSLDEATSSKELVLCSMTSNGVLTILQRGYANTTAVSHASGATASAVAFDASMPDATFRNTTLFGLLYESATDGITAYAGGGQTNATLISTEVARITSVVTAGDSVKLPPITKPGLTIVVINHGGNPVQVFGSGTDVVNDQAAATGISQMNNSEVIYTATKLGVWYANGIGTGYAGSFPTVSYTDNITASATQTQAAGTPIVTVSNRIVTVAAAGNAVTLPIAAGGMSIVVANSHALNAVNVFPGVGDAINAGAANAAFSLPAGKTATFNAMGTLHWHAVLSA